MRFPNAKILVFTKAPIPGTVKTRLIPSIGQQAATELHQELLLQTLSMLAAAQLCPLELWVAAEPNHPFIVACQQRFSLTVHQQVGCDLGERMHHALNQQAADCAAILVGSDIPSLSVDYLTRAIMALTDDEGWVVGPAEDGGYVLVGTRASDMHFFAGVEWGGANVLSQTLSNADSMGCQLKLLEPLWDLDNHEDLQRWRRLQRQEG